MVSTLTKLAGYTVGYAAFSALGRMADEMQRNINQERKFMEEEAVNKEIEYEFTFGEQAIPMIRRVVTDLMNLIAYLGVPIEDVLAQEAQSIIDTMKYLEEQTQQAKARNKEQNNGN